MKTIKIVCRWETIHDVDVPDDYEFTGTLDEEWADQVTPDDGTASLVDWEMREGWANGYD